MRTQKTACSLDMLGLLDFLRGERNFFLFWSGVVYPARGEKGGRRSDRYKRQKGHGVFV